MNVLWNIAATEVGYQVLKNFIAVIHIEIKATATKESLKHRKETPNRLAVQRADQL